MTSSILKNSGIIDVVKQKWIYIAISLILIIPGIVAMAYLTMTTPSHMPLKPGIDFTGGTLLQYGFKQELVKDDVVKMRDELTKIGIENPVIQIEGIGNAQGISKDIKNIASIRTKFLESTKENNQVLKVNNALKNKFGEFELLQVSAIGPTLGAELFKNAVIALLLAFIAIVAYLSLRFQLDYALFAIFALFHDAVFVCGAFAILGVLYNTEIDSLFITAILTVIGFSVHDTIVVYDRIRENTRFLAKKKTFAEIVNASVNQTMARSINTSLTVLLTLLALFFLGGATTKDFVLAMILGITTGTYSSIFVASMLIALWRSRKTAHARA